MCLSLVAESEKLRKQGHRGAAIKPVKYWLCEKITTKNLQNKNNKNGDFKKKRDIKKNQKLL